MKHTPGPWKIIDSTIWSENLERIADISGVHDFANALLMSAAPEMYEAPARAVKMISEEYCSHTDPCSGTNKSCYAQMQHAALEKAEGKSK